MLKYCVDRYKSRKMCENVADACLPALIFAPYWFVMNKMLEKFYDTVFSNVDIVFVDEDIVFVFVDFGNTNLDYVALDEADPDIIIQVRLLAGPNKYKQHKLFKKDIAKKLFPTAR